MIMPPMPRPPSRMRQTLGADGDFAYAYVIAHEVGHHVQHLLGTLDKAHSAMAGQSEKEANKTSVRRGIAASALHGACEKHQCRRTVCAAELCKLFGPYIFGRRKYLTRE